MYGRIHRNLARLGFGSENLIIQPSVQILLVTLLGLQTIGDKSTLTPSECELLEITQRATRVAGLPSEIVQGERVLVHVDREEMEKVVINLLVNAMESGSAMEALEVQVGNASQPYFRVIDKGCGMTNEFISENLFKPFKSTKQKGFGIGLYQCRQIVEAHKGWIDVHSALGEGTTFTVWLPKAVHES